jgi:homoserine kinase
MSRRARVRVPASSANLGPGFDVLAAALALHVEVEVEETGAFGVETDLAIARDRRNLCVRGFARLLDPGRFTFRISAAVPLSGGLGASAAAVVGGLLAAEALRGDRVDLLAEATALEGHPDNAAAALLGGFVVCADGRALRLGVPTGLEAVLVVPHEAVRTARARAALPADVPLADAAFNVAHAALLVLGLERGDPALIAAGLADRLHQPRRAQLYPRSYALLERAPALGALGATISGAGPSVLLWAGADHAGAVADRARAEVGEWAQVLRVPVASEGAIALLNGGQ